MAERRLRGGRLAALAALLTVVAVAGGARHGASVVARWLNEPAGDRPELPAVVTITPGEGALAIAHRLSRLGHLDRPEAFALYLRVTERASRLQAGEYLLETPLSPRELADLLVSGRVLLHPFTIPEGLDLAETAELLARTGWWTVEELEAAFADPTPARAWDDAAPDLEGYLLPETYRLPRGTTASELALVATRAFERAWREADGPRRHVELGLTPREVTTLASLIEKETALPQEHRLVSSVYHNRLARGMKLEADPTVITGLKRAGLWTGGPLTRDDLKHDSPYNTYVHPGLPPGPLCSPGSASLRAALDPAESRLLFFVASGDGGHRFAETAAQHRRNVAAWRRFQRRQRLGGAGE